MVLFSHAILLNIDPIDVLHRSTKQMKASSKYPVGFPYALAEQICNRKLMVPSDKSLIISYLCK